MLGLIYSEVVKRLKLRGAVEFLVQLQLPKVGTDLWWPQAIVKEAAAGDLEDSALKQQKAGTQAAGMQQNLLTSEVVLSEVSAVLVAQLAL